jgi:hypothetical protein
VGTHSLWILHCSLLDTRYEKTQDESLVVPDQSEYK